MTNDRPLGVTVIGVSLLHPAIVILFQPVILSFKLALCGAFIVFSIGILKAKRSAYYILIIMAIFGLFLIIEPILRSIGQPFVFKRPTLLDFISSGFVCLVYNISVLIVLTRPKAIDFFYSEFNKAEDKSAS